MISYNEWTEEHYNKLCKLDLTRKINYIWPSLIYMNIDDQILFLNKIINLCPDYITLKYLFTIEKNIDNKKKIIQPLKKYTYKTYNIYEAYLGVPL